MLDSMRRTAPTGTIVRDRVCARRRPDNESGTAGNDAAPVCGRGRAARVKRDQTEVQ
jgi:hypothetical protein